MDNNIKIAKELVKLAKSLVAEKTYTEQWKDIVVSAYGQDIPEKYNISSLVNDRHSEEELSKVAVEYFEEKKNKNPNLEDFWFINDGYCKAKKVSKE